MKKNYLHPEVTVVKLQCENLLNNFSVGETEEVGVHNKEFDGEVL